jgi:hypothetical protein
MPLRDGPSSKPTRTRRFLVFAPALALVLSAFAYLVYQAWAKPSIEFLIPSARGAWVVEPSGKLSGSMTLRRRFDLEDVPARARLKLKAMSRYSLTVNGRAVEPDSQSPPRNWKRFRSYDIAPELRPGKNTIAIEVLNPDGPPALLAAGLLASGRGGKIRLDTGRDWEIRLDPDRRWVDLGSITKPARTSAENGGFFRSAPGRALLLLLLTGQGLIFLLGLSPLRSALRRRLCPAKTPAPADASPSAGSPALYGRRLGSWPFLAVAAVALVVNLHNTLTFPPQESAFDGVGHVEYIWDMAYQWRAPLATDGWQMYQPPFYYFVSALVYRLFGGGRAEPGSLRAVQVSTMASGLALLLVAYLLLRRLFKDKPALQLLGFSIVAFMPMSLYLNPVISNEVFAGALMALALYLLTGAKSRLSLNPGRAALLGVVVGLALLSKVSALFIFLTIGAVLAGRALDAPSDRKPALRALAVFVLVAAGLSGWYYFRNLRVFGDPLVGNWDKRSGFEFEQAPGYRTLGFYTRFGSVLADGAEGSLNASFWDGNYASMWMDPHENFVKLASPRVRVLGRLILCLAFLPSLAILLGFLRALRSALRAKPDDPAFALVLLSLLWLIAGFSFTMEVPFFSTVKAFFFISLLPALAAFAAKGFEAMAAGLGRFRWLLYANLAALYALVLNLFWFRGH